MHIPEYDVSDTRKFWAKEVGENPVGSGFYLISGGALLNESVQAPGGWLEEVLLVISTHGHDLLRAGLQRFVRVRDSSTSTLLVRVANQ